MQVVLVLLQEVLRVELVAVVRLRRLVLRAADELRRAHGEGHRRTGLRDPGGDARQVGDAGRGPRLVDAVDLVVDVAQEQHEGTNHREIVLARGDDRVAGLVGVQVRVDEVDDELAAGDTASAGFAVEVLRRALHAVGGALEQSGCERVVDVGDHGDADLGRRDPDLGRLGRLIARLRGHRGRAQRHEGDHGHRGDEHLPDPDHDSPSFARHRACEYRIHVPRVAIVTGSASGIGRATADLLGATDVLVAGFDLAGEPPVDVRDGEAVADAVARVHDELGAIDIVVNAAGAPAGGMLADDAYVEKWERSLAVNLTGAMHVVRASLADLLASDAGRIVNVASTEGLVAARRTSPYIVAKHGLIGFTRALAVDYGRQGLTANAVCPGATLTGMTAAIPAADRDVYSRRNIPTGRYGTPEEIAHMIVALTAVEASYVNGAVIPVDGGMTAMG